MFSCESGHSTVIAYATLMNNEKWSVFGIARLEGIHATSAVFIVHFNKIHRIFTVQNTITILYTILRIIFTHKKSSAV